MNKNELNEKIYAAALGCLDKKELLSFKEIDSKPDFIDKKLGVYQHLTSLLPLILDSLEPDEGIKDRIARRVYRIKENTADTFIDTIIETKPTTTSTSAENNIIPKQEVVINEQHPEVKEQPLTVVINDDNKPLHKPHPDIDTNKEEKIKPITERFEKVNTLADDDIKNDIVITQKKLDVVIEDKKTQKKLEDKKPVEPEVMTTATEPIFKEEPEPKNKFFIILLVLISAVATIGSAFVYLKFSSENDKYLQQISSLKSQLRVLNEVAAANSTLIGLLESHDLKIINMSSLKGDSSSLIRVLISGNTKFGFLQTAFSEGVLGNQSLNLWSISGVEKNLLTTFLVNTQNKFHAFNLQVPDASAEIIFAVTKAADADTTATADSLLFSGSFLYIAE